MNKLGEISTLGLLITVVIAVLIATAFWGTIGDSIGQMTRTFSITNATVTSAVAGANVSLTGQKVVNTPIVTNKTSGVVVENNFTFNQRIGSDNVVEAIMTSTTLGGLYVGQPVNVTYNYQPKGYIVDSGSRAMVNLIAIFLAIGILAIAIFPVLKSGLLDLIKGI